MRSYCMFTNQPSINNNKSIMYDHRFFPLRICLKQKKGKFRLKRCNQRTGIPSGTVETWMKAHANRMRKLGRVSILAHVKQEDNWSSSCTASSNINLECHSVATAAGGGGMASKKTRTKEEESSRQVDKNTVKNRKEEEERSSRRRRRTVFKQKL